MNNRKRKTDPKSSIVWGIIALVMLLSQAVSGAAIGGGDIFGFVAVIVVIGVIGFAIAFIMAKKKGMMKKAGSVYQKGRAQERAMEYFTREETAEEKAVGCTHPRGKEKYIHQLDNFLANGIIDKNEYRVLKARYEKANIPENMH